MKIVFDGRIFQYQKFGGINRYFCEVISRLPDDWTPIITGVGNLGAMRPAHPALVVRHGPQFRPRRIARRLRQELWEQRCFRKPAILHPTYYDLVDGCSFSRVRCPVIVTVHDMTYACYPDLFPAADQVIAAQRESVLRADHIICVSRATERDLVDKMPEAAGKTTVIHLASSFNRASVSSAPVAGRSDMFLYVGARERYKNFSFLIRAFAKARSARPGLRLQVAGSPFSLEEKWELKLLGLGSAVVNIVFPDEQKLETLYRESNALLYPSLHEGFGIPPLEAMSCGTIAVTSNTTSLPEVVGDGGIQLSGSDESAWTECILALARDSLNRGELIARGSRQVARFSWDETARRHVEIYRRFGEQ